MFHVVKFVPAVYLCVKMLILQKYMIHIPSMCPPPAPPHTGGEGEHRQAAGSGGGSAGP